MGHFLITYPAVAMTLVIVAILAVRWFIAPTDRRRTEWLLVAACLVESIGAFFEVMANYLGRFRLDRFDLYIYRFDALFGSPSFWLGQLTWRHLWLHNLISVSYGMLPIAIFGVFAVVLCLGSEQEALKVVRTFGLLFVIGATFYLILPVSGPVYAFSEFPTSPLQVTPHVIALPAAPNGVTSGHMGAALLVLWFLRKWHLGKAAGILFVGLTMLATLGSGQHYFFDLLCAVPFTGLMIWLGSLSIQYRLVWGRQSRRCEGQVSYPSDARPR